MGVGGVDVQSAAAPASRIRRVKWKRRQFSGGQRARALLIALTQTARTCSFCVSTSFFDGTKAVREFGMVAMIQTPLKCVPTQKGYVMRCHSCSVRRSFEGRGDSHWAQPVVLLHANVSLLFAFKAEIVQWHCCSNDLC